MLIVFCVYFALFGLICGWHRLRVDFWPLDQSVDGPNVYASFIWLPIAVSADYLLLSAELSGAPLGPSRLLDGSTAKAMRLIPA